MLLSLVTVSRVFSQRQALAPQSETISFRIIVVESEDAAKNLLGRLMKGENFVALARSVSVDPSATNGGLVGPLSIADLRPQIRTVLEGLRDGDLSGVVRLPTGFGILKIVPDSESATASTAGSSSGSNSVMASFTSALAGTGSVKYVYDLSGYAETVLSLRQVTLSPEDSRDLATLCRVRKQLVASTQTLVQKALATAATSPMPPIDHAQAFTLQGQLHAFLGDMAPAIASLEQARQIAAAQIPDLRLQLDEALGIAHLHKAEIDNEIYHRPDDRCLLSGKPGHPFAKTADLVKAIEYFTRYLAERPDDLEVRWLLNITHM